MTSTTDQHRLMNSLRDEEYRRAYADEQVPAGLAFQIRALRDDRGWTQKQLAERTGAAQPTISQWEDPDYEGYTLTTLKKLAAAFDVALLARFVPFSGLAEWSFGLTPERLAPASYDEEVRQQQFSGSPAMSADVPRTYDTFPPDEVLKALTSTALYADYSWDVQNAGSDSAANVQTKKEPKRVKAVA